MNIRLILVPYHLGKARIGMGLGPERILKAGLIERLRLKGYPVEVEEVIVGGLPVFDERTAIGLVNRALAGAVRHAHENGYLPIILAGNCNSALGTIAGLNPKPIGVIWVDAHGDFNTPENSPTGYFDGMPLAAATGLCYPEVLALSGGQVITGQEVLHLGGRDFDPGERELMVTHQVNVITADCLHEVGVDGIVSAGLDRLRKRSRSLYLHLDLDVLETAEAHANQYRTPGGLKVSMVEEIIRKAAEQATIKAVSISSYHPVYDKDGRAVQAAVNLLELAVEEIECYQEPPRKP